MRKLQGASVEIHAFQLSAIQRLAVSFPIVDKQELEGSLNARGRRFLFAHHTGAIRTDHIHDMALRPRGSANTTPLTAKLL